MFAVVVSFQT